MTGVSLRYPFIQFCVCPNCRSRLGELDGVTLKCPNCGSRFSVDNGVLDLLPEYVEETRRRYLESYERVAADDLRDPLEHDRRARHVALARFVGDQRHRRVLDIGSSDAQWLSHVNADFAVAFDIARTYLDQITPGPKLARVRGDAEFLPFVGGFFDTVVISDVLEHVLQPANVVDRVRELCRPQTRVFVHVPWEEPLDSYAESEYEFTHLRRFTEYSLRDLWRGFDVKRSRFSGPDLDEPLSAAISRRWRRIGNAVADRYLHDQQFAVRDYRWRLRLQQNLPKREQLLLRLFRARFRMVELRPRRGRFVAVPPAPPATPARPIMTLIPHDPDNDPRIGWVLDDLDRIGPNTVLGAVAVEGRVKRAYDGVRYVERVNIHQYASRRAKRWVDRLARLYFSGPAQRYLSREGRPPAATGYVSRLRAWIDHQKGAVYRLAHALAWYHLIGSALYRRAAGASTPPRLIICHDIYALVPAVRLKRKFGCPVLYDSHEYWPEADLIAQPWERHVMAAIERPYIRRADAVVTVTPQLAEHLRRFYNLKKVVVAPNATPYRAPSRPSRSGNLQYPIRFLLQGGIAPGRGIEELVREWHSMGDPRALLYLRCPENEHLALLRERHAEALASGLVTILPAVSEDELVEAATFADVGVIPYPATTLNHVFACPNKLSQYMHAGLAILGNRLEFVAQVIERERCGWVYDAATPGSLREAVAEIVGDLPELEARKRFALEAGRESFNWETEGERYRATIQELLSRDAG